MVLIARRTISIMVMYAIIMHFIWAGLVWYDDAATSATAVNALARFIHPPWMLATVIFSCAWAATVGLFTRVPWIVVLLMPQQILLMMSASGAIEAIWLAQFADGITRPWAFIAADQIYSILAAAGHTVAIAAHASRLVHNP